jgi:predicted signal transduction protein with EAL and GGDEF domain
MALYRAKEDRRGTYRFFEPGMDASARARRLLEIDLRDALTRNEFAHSSQNGTNYCLWSSHSLESSNHPLRGMISPMDFIPLAEETGLITQLGDWILRKACMDAAAWSREVRVAVNLSPVQFKNSNLAQSVISALAGFGLAPERLELKITESVLLQDSEATLAALHKLRSFGVKISMDDFGTSPWATYGVFLSIRSRLIDLLFMNSRRARIWWRSFVRSQALGKGWASRS